jgi:hypothetical protein
MSDGTDTRALLLDMRGFGTGRQSDRLAPSSVGSSRSGNRILRHCVDTQEKGSEGSEYPDWWRCREMRGSSCIRPRACMLVLKG